MGDAHFVQQITVLRVVPPPEDNVLTDEGGAGSRPHAKSDEFEFGGVDFSDFVDRLACGGDDDDDDDGGGGVVGRLR